MKMSNNIENLEINPELTGKELIDSRLEEIKSIIEDFLTDATNLMIYYSSKEGSESVFSKIFTPELQEIIRVGREGDDIILISYMGLIMSYDKARNSIQIIEIDSHKIEKDENHQLLIEFDDGNEMIDQNLFQGIVQRLDLTTKKLKNLSDNLQELISQYDPLAS